MFRNCICFPFLPLQTPRNFVTPFIPTRKQVSDSCVLVWGRAGFLSEMAVYRMAGLDFLSSCWVISAELTDKSHHMLFKGRIW